MALARGLRAVAGRAVACWHRPRASGGARSWLLAVGVSHLECDTDEVPQAPGCWPASRRPFGEPRDCPGCVDGPATPVNAPLLVKHTASAGIFLDPMLVQLVAWYDGAWGYSAES